MKVPAIATTTTETATHVSSRNEMWVRSSLGLKRIAAAPNKRIETILHNGDGNVGRASQPNEFRAATMMMRDVAMLANGLS